MPAAIGLETDIRRTRLGCICMIFQLHLGVHAEIYASHSCRYVICKAIYEVIICYTHRSWYGVGAKRLCCKSRLPDISNPGSNLASSVKKTLDNWFLFYLKSIKTVLYCRNYIKIICEVLGTLKTFLQT